MQLNFPTYNFNIKRQENANYVFDIIRKKFVLLTPEEWVRQHLLHLLVNEKGYPASLIAVERGLEINGLKKRFDALAFDKNGKPLLLVECKSPDIRLDQKTLMQIAVYNNKFGVKHLLVTNGLIHLHYAYDEMNNSSSKNEIPDFISLL